MPKRNLVTFIECVNGWELDLLGGVELCFWVWVRMRKDIRTKNLLFFFI